MLVSFLLSKGFDSSLKILLIDVIGAALDELGRGCASHWPRSYRYKDVRTLA